ncbi:MAG: GTP-binding protein [Blastocatellia bacterium]|nr:GTP-binding protein [Blastocatellia bacterium]
MIQKKICMLGAFAVGKTSLVARYVKSMFSEKYLTTVGVKIEKKLVKVDNQDVMLMLWDLAGEDEFNKVQTSYLRGSSGFILVIDGTRHTTLDVALNLQKNLQESFGKLPFILVFNKADLVNEWEIDPGTIEMLQASGNIVFRSSAKTGQNVEEVFLTLAEMMVK